MGIAAHPVNCHDESSLPKLLHMALVMKRNRARVSYLCICFGLDSFLGTAFIAGEMKKSMVGINRVPNIVWISNQSEMEAMRLVMRAGVKSAVCRWAGRHRPLTLKGPIESYADRQAKASSQVASEMVKGSAEAMHEKVKALPSVQVVMAQPISNQRG